MEMGGLVERQLTQAIGGITEPDERVILRVAQALVPAEVPVPRL